MSLYDDIKRFNEEEEAPPPVLELTREGAQVVRVPTLETGGHEYWGATFFEDRGSIRALLDNGEQQRFKSAQDAWFWYSEVLSG